MTTPAPPDEPGSDLEKILPDPASPPPRHPTPPAGFRPAPPARPPTPPPPQHGQPVGRFRHSNGRPPSANRLFAGFPAPPPQHGSTPGGPPPTPPTPPVPPVPPAPPVPPTPPYYGQPVHEQPVRYGPAPQQYGQPASYGQPPYYAQPSSFGRPYSPALPYGQALQPAQQLQYSQQLQDSQPPEHFGHPQHGRRGADQQSAGGRPWSGPRGHGWEGGAPPLAGFGSRAVSFLIDMAAPWLVLTALLAVGFVLDNLALTVALAGIGYLGVFTFVIWNSCYQQGVTGQSIGRRVAKTKLVKIETAAPVGFGTALVRQICHGVEFGIGYLWPLWDERRQTFADKIVGTVVVRAES